MHSTNRRGSAIIAKLLVMALANRVAQSVAQD